MANLQLERTNIHSLLINFMRQSQTHGKRSITKKKEKEKKKKERANMYRSLYLDMHAFAKRSKKQYPPYITENMDPAFYSAVYKLSNVP